MRTSHPFPSPKNSAAKSPPPKKWPRYLRRGLLENIATGLILMGVGMLMQPFALSLFSYSFVTILAGTGMFMIVSHFPE